MRIKEADRVEVAVGRVGVAWRDFRLVLLGALVLLVLVALGETVWFLQPLRLILGLTYVLYIPGYCLTVALFPRVDDLDGIERVGLHIGLSIALVSLLALLLDRLPWGLHLWPILLGEYCAMVLFAAIALWRRSQLPAAAAYVPALTWWPWRWWRSLPPPEQRIYTLLAGVLLLVSLLAVWIFLVPSPDEFMTEFYILGKAGLAEDYPREVAPGQEMQVQLGINNHEGATARYRVEVRAGGELLTQAGPITLEDGATWEAPLRYALARAGDDQQIDILLFQNDDTAPYRQLRLWVNVRSKP